MKIKKTEPSVGILGKIVNLFSNSKQDTYSCDYINKIIDNEVILFEGKFLGDSLLEKDFSPYKRLLITYSVYDGSSTNTGGASNILMLDLNTTSDRYEDYVATNMHPYNMYQSEGNITGTLGIACKVNADKTNFGVKFMLNQKTTIGETYYVSKIIGVK